MFNTLKNVFFDSDNSNYEKRVKRALKIRQDKKLTDLQKVCLMKLYLENDPEKGIYINSYVLNISESAFSRFIKKIWRLGYIGIKDSNIKEVHNNKNYRTYFVELEEIL